MTVYFDSDEATVHHGDCLDILATLPDASVDAVVTDPPYGLEFMGKDWDRPWSSRGEKPAGAGLTEGGFAQSNGYANRRTPSYGKAWSAKRCALCGHVQSGGSPCLCEEPQWVIERQHPAIPMRAFQQWVEQWATECLRVLKPGGHMLAFGGSRTWHRLAGGIEDAGFEIRDSIAWLYGSGFPKSLNVAKAIASGGGRPEDIRRMQMGDAYEPSGRGRVNYDHGGGSAMNGAPDSVVELPDEARAWEGWGTALKPAFEPIVVARKPLAGTVAANVLAHGTGALHLDACREPDADDQRAKKFASVQNAGVRENSVYGADARSRAGATPYEGGRHPANVLLDASQAAVLDASVAELPARFFYTAKASGAERPNVNGVQHPTVKPLDLMRWLVRLVTPRGGVVLEPFAGSGTTVEAAVSEGFRCIAVEREAEYLPLIASRLDKPIEQVMDIFGGAA